MKRRSMYLCLVSSSCASPFVHHWKTTKSLSLGRERTSYECTNSSCKRRSRLSESSSHGENEQMVCHVDPSPVHGYLLDGFYLGAKKLATFLAVPTSDPANIARKSE